MPATIECEHIISTLTDNRSQEHVPKPQLHAGNQLSTMHCALRDLLVLFKLALTVPV